MSVTQVQQAAGQWSVRLGPNTPQSIIDRLVDFGHVVVTQTPEDVRVAGDGVLSTALYTGVIRGRAKDESGTELSGAGLAIWLGDEDDKGPVLETTRTYSAQTFTSVVADLLPSRRPSLRAPSAASPARTRAATSTRRSARRWTT